MGSNAKWVEGWFTRPGWFWCVLVFGDGKPRIAKVLQGSRSLYADVEGTAFARPQDIKCWLDAEIVPPALPGEGTGA